MSYHITQTETSLFSHRKHRLLWILMGSVLPASQGWTQVVRKVKSSVSLIFLCCGFSGLIPLVGRNGSWYEVWWMLSPGLWLFCIRHECMHFSASQTWFTKFFIVFPFWGAIRYNISYWFWNCFYNANKYLSEKPCTNHTKMWSCGSWSAAFPQL